MKKKFKKALLSATVILMSMNTVCVSAMELVYDGQVHKYNEKPIHLYVNDEQVETKVMPPVQIEGRVLVPAREVFEPLGAKVEWKSYEKKVYVQYEDRLIVLGMNDLTAWIDGETVLMDVPAKSINDKIMVPVRFISEEIGFDVKWVTGNPREVRILASNQTMPDEEIKPELPPEIKPDPTPEPEPMPEPELPSGSGLDLKENDYIAIPTAPNQNVVYPQLGEGDGLIGTLRGLREMYMGSPNLLSQWLEPMMFETTTIQNVGVLSGDTTVVYIDALSEISDFKASMQSGKLIIDIPNSKNQLSSSITPATNPYISGIRTSQFTSDTTRIVFDLKSPAKPQVMLGDTRLGIQIEFSPQEIEMIGAGEEASHDYIVIQNIVPSQLKISENQDKYEMTVTIPNTTLSGNLNWGGLNQKYINSVSARETREGVVLTVVYQPGVKVITQTKEIAGHTYIRFAESSLKNVSYQHEKNPMITLRKPQGLSAGQMRMKDSYTTKKIVIDLGADYQTFFDQGVYSVQDDKVNQFYMVTEGTTKLVIDEKTVQAVNVYESDNMIQIELVKPQQKYGRVVVIDPGHGGSDGGASANGIREKEINLEQAMLVYDLLQRDPTIKVYATRTNDVYPSLGDRTALANDIEADIFVSVHNNSAGATVKGTEILYYPNSADERSKQMAQIVQNRIISKCGNVDRKVKPRPDLAVLRTSRMPAILLEGGFLTNKEDAYKMKDPSYNQKYARAVYEGIVEIFETLSFR
ncbi:MAG: N-acetylmuramoyl-L-alanine amidase [Cellulosilyticaceae bacterium]